MDKVCGCIPICDHRFLAPLRAGLQKQDRRLAKVLLVDTTARPIPATEWPLGNILRIPPETFDHAGSRRLAARVLGDADILVFLTQDAVPADESAIGNLLAAFADPEVGAAFGRQLPRPEAGPLEAHARLFNYPAESRTTSLADIPRLGLKTAFISNSFAAYRREALAAAGSFPERNIVSEDTLMAARMLAAGWKIAYRADARVFHSHSFSLGKEFRRYFDIGVFHAREPWIRRRFGGVEGEGARFVASELKFLLRHRPAGLPTALLRTPLRYLGFRAGLGERFLPLSLRSRLSMQKAFWAGEKRIIPPCPGKRARLSPD